MVATSARDSESGLSFLHDVYIVKLRQVRA